MKWATLLAKVVGRNAAKNLRIYRVAIYELKKNEGEQEKRKSKILHISKKWMLSWAINIKHNHSW
jgi:hypothetical protein